jgi:hypothetical protein
MTLVILVAAELACRLAGRLWARPAELWPPREAAAEVYPNADWLDDYRQEFRTTRVEWHSYVYWRRQPCQGRWINVDQQGIRRTWNAPDDGKPRPRIFLFGGSTMWGSGGRDDYTIPSCLARRLAELGVEAEVTNFGETGYVSKQELIALLGELAQGNVPGLVVFYDGTNDVYSAFQTGQGGLPMNEANRREQFRAPGRPKFPARSAVRALFPGLLGLRARVRGQPSPGGPPTPSADDEALARDVVRHYEFVVQTVENLGREHGFRTLFYWQPTVFQKTHQTPAERAGAEEQAAVRQHVLGRAYELVRRSPELLANPHFHDLSGLFAAETRPLFLDFCHVGETGNELIARRMADDVRRELARRPGD